MKQVICPCDGKLVSIMPCKDQSEAMASRAILQGLKVNSPVIELSESFFMLFYFQVIFFQWMQNTRKKHRQALSPGVLSDPKARSLARVLYLGDVIIRTYGSVWTRTFQG